MQDLGSMEPDMPGWWISSVSNLSFVLAYASQPFQVFSESLKVLRGETRPWLSETWMATAPNRRAP